MQWINVTSRDDLMVVVSYPLVLVSIPISLLLIGGFSFFYSDYSAEPIDYLIFYSVCLAFIPFHFYRKTIINNKTKECILYKRNILKKYKKVVPYKNINNFEVYYGRGYGIVGGGSLILATNDGEKYKVIDSDIQRKHSQKVRSSKKTIDEFIKLSE